mgnify:CR=1 FL=1
MAEYPLLIFPAPNVVDRAKRPPPRGKIKLPHSQMQAERIAPQLKRLQQAMDKHRLALQNDSLGLQPEQALVLETIGSVDRFINAIKKVPGLEWLGEIDIDDIAPDYGFEDKKDPEKPLKGQLFLVMTDQRALRELQSLFNNWQQNPKVKFPRGLAPLKQAFAHLHTIRPWDAEDRIRDTGLLEDWEDRVRHGQEIIPFEVELWFRENPGRQRQAEAYLGNVIDSLGGEILQQCVIPQIAYHGVLGKIPSGDISDLLTGLSELRDFRLFQCEDIMHLRPVGQCAIRVPEDSSELDATSEDRQPDFPQGEPVVALLDGYPLAGHRLLEKRLIVDDPDGYETAYQARERVHGTAMASLVCHGDLDDEDDRPSKRPVYVRPILQPLRVFGDQFFERIPESVLVVDLIHRAVRRLFEAEGEEPPVAPNVCVVNLSVCDHCRPFDRGMSAWARLLDWLSWKYNVLFVVSAGNHPHDIELNIPRADLRRLSAEDREKAVIGAIAADTRHRRLLSPAETFNGITVGASHADASTPDGNPNLIDPFARRELPSTISAQGPGYGRAIKPDILLPGGRQLLSEKMGTVHDRAILQTPNFSRPPGQRVAAPGRMGELNRTFHTRGTSNSAALASHWAILLFDLISQLREQHGSNPPPKYDVVLLKTLLVHGADWGNGKPLYESVLKNPRNSRVFKDYVGRFFGYGVADMAKVVACTDQRVTVLGVGELGDGEGQEFDFPLPPSLSAVTDKRRLTITLAWLTPVSCRRQHYRIAHLWFNPKNHFATDRVYADHHAVQRGTVQHEVLESAKAVDFQDGETIGIKVNCRADAGDIPEPIRYGLAVTLEVAEGIEIPVYQEVKNRLRIRVPIHRAGTT